MEMVKALAFYSILGRPERKREGQGATKLQENIETPAVEAPERMNPVAELQARVGERVIVGPEGEKCVVRVL